jgi:hypothetical protein
VDWVIEWELAENLLLRGLFGEAFMEIDSESRYTI